MINRINAFQVNDKTFATLEEAQTHELSNLIAAGISGLTEEQNYAVANLLVASQTKVLDILTTGPRSKPKMRRINGAKRTRASKEVAA